MGIRKTVLKASLYYDSSQYSSIKFGEYIKKYILMDNEFIILHAYTYGVSFLHVHNLCIVYSQINKRISISLFTNLYKYFSNDL